jgi:hypothetical protein
MRCATCERTRDQGWPHKGRPDRLRRAHAGWHPPHYVCEQWRAAGDRPATHRRPAETNWATDHKDSRLNA